MMPWSKKISNKTLSKNQRFPHKSKQRKGKLTMSLIKEEKVFYLSQVIFKEWLCFDRLVFCSDFEPKFLKVKVSFATKKLGQVVCKELITFSPLELSAIQKKENIVIHFVSLSSNLEELYLRCKEFYQYSSVPLKTSPECFPMIASIARLTGLLRQKGFCLDQIQSFFCGYWTIVLEKLSHESELWNYLFCLVGSFCSAEKEGPVYPHESNRGFGLSVIDYIKLLEKPDEKTITNLRGAFEEIGFFELDLLEVATPKYFTVSLINVSKKGILRKWNRFYWNGSENL